MAATVVAFGFSGSNGNPASRAIRVGISRTTGGYEALSAKPQNPGQSPECMPSRLLVMVRLDRTIGTGTFTCSMAHTTVIRASTHGMGAAPVGPVEPCHDGERRAATFKRLPCGKGGVLLSGDGGTCGDTIEPGRVSRMGTGSDPAP